MRQQQHEAFPLFKGATRSPTIAGVPMTPFLVMFIGIGAFALLFGIWWWLLLGPVWFVMAQITKHDDKAFRILWLWIDTKLRNPNKRFWGASTYSPTVNTRRKR